MVPISKLAILLFIVIAAAMVAGCGGAATSNPTPTPAPSLPPGQSIDLASAANGISAGFGTVETASTGNAAYQVIIFPERHDSRAIQIETAIMLNRMYLNGTKIIALEGLFTDEHLDTAWYDQQGNESAKIHAAISLLKEGEINNAEFIALVRPDVSVRGIEKQSEYDVTISDDAQSSYLFYLMAIAETSMSQAQIKEANRLYDANKISEYVDYVIGSNDWTRTQYAKIESGEITNDITEEIAFYRAFQQKANEVGADIDSQTKADFNEFIGFLESRQKASRTMTDNVVNLCKESPNVPVAMIIGAAHTSEIVKDLKSRNVAFAVIDPVTLNAVDDISVLSNESFNAKYEAKSVDDEGMLGSFLTKKPRQFINTPGGQSKVELYYISTWLAYQSTGGGFPPKGLDDEAKKLQNVRLDTSSVRKEGSFVLFKATAKDNDNRDVTIYARVLATAAASSDIDIEPLLVEARKDVLSSTANQREDALKKEKLVEVTRDVLAVYSEQGYPETFNKI